MWKFIVFLVALFIGSASYFLLKDRYTDKPEKLVTACSGGGTIENLLIPSCLVKLEEISQSSCNSVASEKEFVLDQFKLLLSEHDEVKSIILKEDMEKISAWVRKCGDIHSAEQKSYPQKQADHL